MRIWDVDRSIRDINRFRFQLGLSLLKKDPTIDDRFRNLLCDIRDMNLKEEDNWSRYIAEDVESILRIYGRAEEIEFNGPLCNRKFYVRNRRRILRNIVRKLKIKRRFIRGDQLCESFWDKLRAFFKILLFPVLFLVLIFAIPVITVMSENKKSFVLPLWTALFASIIVPATMGSLLWIIPIVPYVIFHFIITIYVYKKIISDDAAMNMGESLAFGSGEGGRGREVGRELFEGLIPTEAKKKYHALMKKYHPDNVDGNLAMAREISIAYDEYKLRYRGAR